MTYEEFKKAVIKNLPPGKILDNPGGGTTLIKSYTGDILKYQRGKSTFPASLKLFYEAKVKYTGLKLSSSTLKQLSPMFDSNRSGHSCNCTLLFMILRDIGIVDKILGNGRSGDPFYVIL
jgi:hypothetical protein